MFYKELYRPRMADYDRNGKLSYEAILHIFEGVGSHHSDIADDNIMDGSKEGLAWILADWRVEIINRPDNKDEMEITTWIRAQQPTFNVFREFTATDKHGRVMVKGEAKLVLLDVASGSLLRISDELFNAYGVEDKPVFDAPTGKLREAKIYTEEKRFKLRRSDIDFNGHVHNTKYLDYALEALPEEVYSKNSIKEFRIVYKKSVKEGAEVTLKYAFDGTHKVGIYTEDGLCTLIEIK